MKSVAQVAGELGLSGQAVRQALKNGRLKGEKVGWYWIVAEKEMERFKRLRLEKMALGSEEE